MIKVNKNILKILSIFIFTKFILIKEKIDNNQNLKISINLEKKKNNYFNLKEDIKDKTIFFKKINEYLRICRNGTLLNHYYNKRILTPKITAIIPVYNANKTIITAVRSIQNQNMDEIEIILVDDASTDNSIDIFNQLMSCDKRIKLIKNKKNKGTLYSRSIGAINANGKYIMTLDNDDLFIYGIFEKCYEEAEKNNIDIIEFSGLQICHNCSVDLKKIFIPHFLKFKKDGVVVRQPKLSTFDYIRTNVSFDFIDVFVWGKLIKTQIYQKALKTLGNEIYEHNICLTEDKIFTFGLFKVANSFKYIDIYGIIYIQNIESICHTWTISKSKRILHDFFMLSIIFYKLTKSTEEVQIVVDELKKHFKNFSINLDKKHKKLLIRLYNEISNNKNVNEIEKKKIINLMIENKDNLKY